MAPVDRLLRADRLSQTVPPAACPHQRTPVAPSWPPRIIAVTSEIRTGQRQELFFEAPIIPFAEDVGNNTEQPRQYQPAETLTHRRPSPAPSAKWSRWNVSLSLAVAPRTLPVAPYVLRRARKAASAWPLVILAREVHSNRPDCAVPYRVPPIGYGPVRYAQLRPLWGRGRTGYPYHVIRPATHCTPAAIAPPVPSTVPRDTALLQGKKRILGRTTSAVRFTRQFCQ